VVDLPALIADLVGQFSYQAREKDLRLEMDVPARAQITTDKELLNLILQNVLGNAIKYSKRGTIRIGARDGGLWKISIQDQGPGIAKEKLSGLFQSYTRGDTHGQSGTGLGLSIARQAAELLGARLWAESKAGEGSTFHLELPAGPPDGG